MNCPKCGASWSTMAGGKTKFHCGSIATNEGDVSPQSELCKDIEHDKKQLEFLRKWRKVVLSNAECCEVDSWKRHVFQARVAVDFNVEIESGGASEMFDSAVRKEMDIAPEAPH